jgi:peptidoglycan hydrolase CwlO-like protein
MNPEIITALLGGGVAGVMFQSLLKYLQRNKQMHLTNEEKLRQELQEQIDTMKLEIRELRMEVNNWKGKYFDLYEEHVELKALLSKKNPT